MENLILGVLTAALVFIMLVALVVIIIDTQRSRFEKRTRKGEKKRWTK